MTSPVVGPTSLLLNLDEAEASRLVVIVVVSVTTGLLADDVGPQSPAGTVTVYTIVLVVIGSDKAVAAWSGQMDLVEVVVSYTTL